MILLVKVPDYHEFTYMVDSIVNLKCKHIELGMHGRKYVGIVYTGKKPSQKTIDNLLMKNAIKLIDWDDE